MAIFSVEPLQPVTGKSQVPSKESLPIVELSIANALRHIRDRPPSRSSRRLALDREERDRTAYGRRTDHDPPRPLSPQSMYYQIAAERRVILSRTHALLPPNAHGVPTCNKVLFTVSRSALHRATLHSNSDVLVLLLALACTLAAYAIYESGTFSSSEGTFSSTETAAPSQPNPFAGSSNSSFTG